MYGINLRKGLYAVGLSVLIGMVGCSFKLDRGLENYDRIDNYINQRDVPCALIRFSFGLKGDECSGARDDYVLSDDQEYREFVESEINSMEERK